MFFIGIFGIDNKFKEIKVLNNFSCKNCNISNGASLVKYYTFFHFFFIPIFKWNEEYYVICNGCNSSFSIPKEKGKAIERGEDIEISYWDLKDNNINRFEYESCGYKLNIAKGNHTLHMPFYVTNTSQYCTLYAKCTRMNRGRQKLVMGCPMYCKDYIFSYPKHLKMVGKYNSLFSFDDTLLHDSKKLEQYINEGIDRILLNFI